MIVLAIAMIGYGVWSARRTSLDVFPDFAPPQVDVQTEAPGLAPEQVERLVTAPIEASLGGLGELESLRSESIQGLSVVTVVFDEDADVFRVRQLLGESLAEVSARLPAGVGPPHMSPVTSATMDVLKLGLVSDRLSPLALRSFADWTLRPRLLMVPGVARVNVFGGAVRQLGVEVDPDALDAHQVALADVVAAAGDASAHRGAGFVDTPNQRIVIEAAPEGPTASALGEAMIDAAGGAPVRLRDVARVGEVPARRFGDASIQGRSGVLLTLSSQYGANTMKVTRALEAALSDLAPVFEREGITVFPRLHRPASFIESALANLRLSLAIGTVLVFTVLLLFLRAVRTALISLTAIPLSLLTAIAVLDRLGVGLDTMTLGGLAIAIGEVVDDAIIDVENILRRLRENDARGAPRSALAVVLDASIEVRGAVIFATASVALVFLPLLGLSGLQGRLLAPLALAYLLAILASLGTALTVTPALSLALLARDPGSHAEPALQRRLKAAYRATLIRVDRRPGPLFAAIAVAFVAALAIVPTLGGELLPEFRESHLVVHLDTAPGASLSETLRIGTVLSRRILAMPGVLTVEQQAGRAEQGEDTWGPERSELHVELDPDGPVSAAETADRIREALAPIPGVQSEVLTFLGDRIAETITGETAEVVVNLFGDDLDRLDASAREVARLLRGLPGAVDGSRVATITAPHVEIGLRPRALARLGIRPAEVLDQIQTAYAGTAVGQSYRGDQMRDVVVTLDPGRVRDPEVIGALLVRGARGGAAPLHALATLRPANGRAVILHEGGKRRQTVTCNVSGRDVASFVREAREAVRTRIALPRGVYAVFGGAGVAREGAVGELALHAGLGVAGVVLLLSLGAGHGRNLLLLLATLPFALMGGVFALAIASWSGLASGGVSLGALVGFATLFGVSVRNAILMLSHFQHLVGEEGVGWGPEAALRGASERVVPIAMTALVTGLGLLPIALGADRPGGEIDGPMAIVILGGLGTATLLNLLALPVLSVRYGRFAPRPTTAATDLR